MLLDKSLNIKWNNATKDYYISKGYNYTKKNDIFTIDIEDMITTSTIRVNVKCDYCGDIHKKEYRGYIKGREYIDKDCCSNTICRNRKLQDVNLKLYGVKNAGQRDDVKAKLSKIKRMPFNQVKSMFDKKELDLISRESDYINGKSKLKFICNYHKEKGIQTTTLDSLRSSKHCCNFGAIEHVSNIRRFDIEKVKSLFVERGYIPKFDTYENNQIPIPFMCEKHMNAGIQYVSYANLQQGQRGCKVCSIESVKDKHREDKNIVYALFHEKGLSVLDGEEYLNKDTHMKFTCNKHPNIIQSTTYAGLKRTDNPCYACRNELSYSKLNKRLRSSIGKWRRKTEIKCKSKCVLTSSEVYDIHHLHQYNAIVVEAVTSLKLDVNNINGVDFENLKNKVIELHETYGEGVCIHPELHQLLHMKFGKDTTIEDYYKFKENYLNGVYDNEIKISKLTPRT